MSFLKREKSYVKHRLFQEGVIDKLDFLRRMLTRQLDLPPYSLRSLSGGAKDFKDVGPWFLNEFQRLGLFRENCRILDVGCGCGRLAHTFSEDSALRRWNVQYVGMDIDRKAILWCRRHITSKNKLFQFYHADLRSRSYNPTGKHSAQDFQFPHQNGAFDLIIATSVFTHLLKKDLQHYLSELFRLLATEGSIYASFFVYSSRQEAIEGVARHPVKFPCYHGDFSTHSDAYPENAIAYEKSFLLDLVESTGFELERDIMYGIQDVLLLKQQRR